VLSPLGLQTLILLSDKAVTLQPGESKVITIDFLARENTAPDLYLGSIKVKGVQIEKELLLAIEVKSKTALFDVIAEIPSTYLYVLPGEQLVANINLLSFGKPQRIDGTLEYIIKDSSGNIILSKNESVALETRASFIKSFEIPADLAYGVYILHVKLTYDRQAASSSAFFTVGKPPVSVLTPSAVYAIIALAALALALLAWYLIPRLLLLLRGENLYSLNKSLDRKTIGKTGGKFYIKKNYKKTNVYIESRHKKGYLYIEGFKKDEKMTPVGILAKNVIRIFFRSINKESINKEDYRVLKEIDGARVSDTKVFVK
jgi:hypothetical protein